jgi:hypothetical protein
MSTEFLLDGPDDAPRTLLLAHGAGAPMDSPFMHHVAEGLAAAGWRVARFEFPYMAARRVDGKKRGPNPAHRLEACFREAIAEIGDPARLVIGGKSMGGRIASRIADDAGVAGLLALGYPFHPPGKPERLRTAHLAGLRTPALILQGERDTFGGREEVGGYDLAATIQLGWLPDGDHSFKPRKRSGYTLEGNLDAAVAAADAFLRAL